MGIDLGTSFTAAAVASAGTVNMVPLAGQALVTPSVAFLDEKGTLLTGEAADRLGLQDPGRTTREFKRRLGDPTPVILDGAPYSPTALMAGLLRSVVDTVSQAQGGPPERIVLTHPAVWGPYRREQFAAIPHLAGLSRPDDEPGTAAGSNGPTVVTTTEPVAAATYYCSTQPLPPDGLLAVYDLGGGTFDSAVVRNGRDGLEIVGTPEGIEWLGGADFDQALVDHVDRQLDGAVTALDPADPGTTSILATLQRNCMLAKEALSSHEKAEIRVPLPESVRHVTVTREAFEQMITPPVETTIETFRRTLTAAGITLQDLTAVLLVGGSSQIPLVNRMLRDTLRRPIMINTHPKHAVALGAAMLSAAPRPAARAIPAPRRPEPAAPPAALAVAAPARTEAPPATVGRDSDAPAAAAPRTAAAFAAAATAVLTSKGRRSAKHRAQPPAPPAKSVTPVTPVSPVSGPPGPKPPADVPPPPWRRWSRLAITRVVVALVAVFSLVGAVLVFGTDTPTDPPRSPSATSIATVPSSPPPAPTPNSTPRATTTPSSTPRPSSPPARSATPSKRPTQTVLALTDVRVGKPSKLSKVRPAEVGAKHFVDRTVKISSIPGPLDGGVLIPGSSDDKRMTSPADYLTFDVARNATVYVAVDSRGAPNVDNWWPAWLNQQGFARTSMTIKTTDTAQPGFVVFAKQVPAGPVTLGPNSATSVYSTGYITVVTAR
ncbi:Hsp70 family protein [Micromonospora echinospora]|uniref:Hsp70 family protein n=1 Tax=Micromonospora echinospora TaxID=1877 RepID=UPI0014758518|nr:Hsp70 family protein [Micromonospora echinospora]